MKTKNQRTLTTTLLTMCMLLGATLASAGHYYESVTEHNTAGKRKGDTQNIKAWVEGDQARIEFVSGEKKGYFADGNYLVTTDAGENVYLVNPKDETYGRFNLDEMMATVGQMMNMLEEMGDMVKIEITDTSSEKILEEPGESILGHDTTHYRYKSGYTMNMKMMGINRQNRNDTVMDIWSTDALDAQGFGVWLRPDRQMKTGNEGLDEMMAQQFGQIQGFPLKMAMEMTSTNKKGKGQTSNTTMEVTVLREESISDSQFTWPDNYTEIEILPDVEQQTKDSKKKKKK
jgi:hypothetical protein